MGVAVVVVGADAHDRDAGADRVEEAVGVGVAAVVRDLEHLGAQLLGAGEQPPLGPFLGVAGEQQPPRVAVHAQDQRALVGVVGQRAVAGGTQHRHGCRPEPEAGARGDLVERDAALPCDGQGRQRRRRHVPARARADGGHHGVDLEACQDRGQTGAVVVMRMAERDDVEPAHPAPPQQAQRRVGVGTAVHEHPGAAAAIRCFHQQGVALPHVEGGQRQRRHRWRPAQGRGDSHDGGGDDGDRRQARQPPPHEQGQDRQHQQR